MQVCRAQGPSGHRTPRPTIPPITRNTRVSLGACLWDQERKQARSLRANCLRELDAWRPVFGGHLFPFPVTAFAAAYRPPSTGSQACHPGLTRGQAKPAAASTNGKKEGAWPACGEAMSAGGHGGALWLCSGLPKPVGGRGLKIYCSQAGCKGKGRLYKFLDFMTVLHQRNVHSICWDVSTANMQWAY